jgi:hypothetical protein
MPHRCIVRPFTSELPSTEAGNEPAQLAVQKVCHQFSLIGIASARQGTPSLTLQVGGALGMRPETLALSAIPSRIQPEVWLMRITRTTDDGFDR